MFSMKAKKKRKNEPLLKNTIKISDKDFEELMKMEII